MSSSPTKQRRKARGTSLAELADKYKCYQLSVQEPGHEVDFFTRVYRGYFGRRPRLLREDFCGTFAVCCEWVKLDPQNRAVGYDLDPEPLNWGRQHNLAPLAEEQQARVALHQADVREVAREKAEVLAAQNFSFWLFKTRPEVRDYFKAALKNLARDGMFVLDMMGGSDCYLEEHEDVRKIKGAYFRDDVTPPKSGRGLKSFEYVWEQHAHNPITRDASFFIHFRFKDGSALERAFEYHWRFWTPPEVVELLREAGFGQVDVFWEKEDADGEANGEWTAVTTAPADASWITYIVARR